jgi:hypothetical protein
MKVTIRQKHTGEEVKRTHVAKPWSFDDQSPDEDPSDDGIAVPVLQIVAAAELQKREALHTPLARRSINSHLPGGTIDVLRRNCARSQSPGASAIELPANRGFRGSAARVTERFNRKEPPYSNSVGNSMTAIKTKPTQTKGEGKVKKLSSQIRVFTGSKVQRLYM